ncbi:MAG: acyl-CoA dehydrogenase family protein [Bacteroidota bacterium]|nr:acyl-CoA dehydrogenase family protein [Bacteroidota bacterium]MDP4233117.1 acyl-CoA dehydrogenase family protein [Bacteroidota bacterium]MDP4241738.1 acyl-CoA dehydrogenase family protein [Bacteroidota bacterium]MDP4287396.1 acyl-CoA dehydrogenase family protein [Bacteroidota bacterium]
MDFNLNDHQIHWQSVAREFAQQRVAPIAREMDESGEMPLTLVGEMASLGLLGSTLPKSLGGSEMDNVSLALVYEELGRACSSVRGFMTVHSSLVMQCIHQWGTDEQKQRYLPAMAKGEAIGCYALTEPEAGSDAASIQTIAKKNALGYALNGEKIWITNGNIARIAVVFARLDTLHSKKPHEQVTAFLVRLNTPEVERLRMPGEELGHRASDHATLVFHDTSVTTELLLGGEGMGFKVAMSALDHGRLGVAAGALGVHQACLDASLAFVRSRKQFGQRIGDFEMVQSTIAEMKASLDASRLLVYRAAWLKDQGQPTKLETSIAKYFATEAAAKAASDAVLLHGARGYSNEYPVERYYRDIKGLQIYEGTSYIQKIVIAREVIGKPNG